MANKRTEAKIHYKWPWFVLAGFLLAIVLAVLWMSREIERTRRIRDLNSPTPQSSSENTAPANGAHEKPTTAPTNDMVWIPKGTFWMGAEDAQADEKPVHQVTLDGFWMDKTEVSNEQFGNFVRATHYVTVAERKPDPKDFPDASPEMLVPGSIVFKA